MRVLVIGQGGREHAIIRGLKLSPSITEVHALPGREGFSLDEAICHPISVTDFEGIYRTVEQCNISYVIIGPEDPLALGLSDFLREKDVLVVAPSQGAAQLESSKIYSKKFMTEFDIPTSSYDIVQSVEQTLVAAKNYKAPYVFKVDGLAAGKGVYICQTLEELKKASIEVFEDHKFKDAGLTALLEEFQEGWEMSYLVLTNGDDYETMPLSQDHKRLKDNDLGPNTGGMGAVGPLNVDPELLKQIKTEILDKTMQGLKKRNLLYRGTLYVGLMITKEGPRVIEYNARFGDPEAQIIMPLLDGEWGEVFYQISKGILPEVSWKPLCVACVVIAAENYPESPKRGVVIKGDILHETTSSYFLHSGTVKNKNSDWCTDGGRVLNAIGIGSTMKEALSNAYKQAKYSYWDGMQIRTDIGKKIL